MEVDDGGVGVCYWFFGGLGGGDRGVLLGDVGAGPGGEAEG